MKRRKPEKICYRLSQGLEAKRKGATVEKCSKYLIERKEHETLENFNNLCQEPIKADENRKFTGEFSFSKRINQETSFI